MVAAESSPRPNIIFILADDLGFEALNSYGGQSYKTPNLDALAQSGLRFKNAYATPLCSPSRVQLMTGRYGFRTGWTNLIGRGGEDAKDYFDPQKEKTFGHILKSAGYTTAIAGKWQLCDFRAHPNHLKECGFDEYCCWAWEIDGKKTSRYWNPSIWQDGQLREVDGKYGEDIFCDFLIDFIRRQKDKPFFVYYPMVLVHDPLEPTPDSDAKDRAATSGKKKKRQDKKKSKSDSPVFSDMVSYMDKTVGRLVSTLDKLHLRESTLIIFTGDNGTGHSNYSLWNGQPVRGGKGSVTEFGTHVPFIVNWKGTSPAGKVLDDLIDFSDVLPTLAELSGAKPPKDIKIDGRSFAPQLRGQKGNSRDWIFSQLGHERLLRDKKYLLHSDGRIYNVENDPFERDDLSGNPDEQIITAKTHLQSVLDKMK